MISHAGHTSNISNRRFCLSLNKSALGRRTRRIFSNWKSASVKEVTSWEQQNDKSRLDGATWGILMNNAGELDNNVASE